MKPAILFKRKCLLLSLGLVLTAFLLPENLSAQSSDSTITQKVSKTSMTIGATAVWNKDLGDLVMDQPHLQAESVVLACMGGGIKSYYMTGTDLWSFEPNEKVTPFISRSVEGASYMCDSSGFFKAVNRVGRELWRINLGSPIAFTPVVGWDGRVFIPLGSQLLCRTASGNPLWSIDLGSPIAVEPILDHTGSFATVLQNRDFVKVSQFSTVERVRLDQQPVLIVSLKESSGDSYILLYSSREAEKISFNAKAAKGSALSRGRFPSLQAAPAAAVGKDDSFAVTLRDGRVQLINGSGQVTWTGDSHETAAEKGSASLERNQAAMLFDERGIYSISTRGATGFAADGRRRFLLKIPEASSAPGISDEGILYACSKDKSLCAYKLDNKPRTIQRTKYYGYKPEGSYGMGNPPPSPWASDDRRFADDEQKRMNDLIEKAINSGQIGEDEPQYVAYLMEMIGFFLNDPHYSRVRPKVKPIQRIAFIRLLGKVGSRETVPFLWKIFDKDEEPSVKAACAEAIGKIGVDPEGNTFVSYNFLLAANNPNRDPQLLMSATSSVAALCRFSGPPLSADGILLLRYFSTLTWAPNNIKNQIKSEIDALYKEGIDKVINES